MTAPKAVKNPVLQSMRVREGAAAAPSKAPSAAAALAAARDAARTSRPADSRPPKLADLILQQAPIAVAAPRPADASLGSAGLPAGAEGDRRSAGAAAAAAALTDSSLMLAGNERGQSHTPSLGKLPGSAEAPSSRVAAREPPSDDAHPDVPPLE